MNTIKKSVKNAPVEVFKVLGREFLSQHEAESFVKKAKRALEAQYFTVSYCPDLTEGRGYYKTLHMAVAPALGENLVHEVMKKLRGSLVEWVQGVSPMPSFTVQEITTMSTNPADKLDEINGKLSVGIVGLGRSHAEPVAFVDALDVKTEKELKMLVDRLKADFYSFEPWKKI